MCPTLTLWKSSSITDALGISKRLRSFALCPPRDHTSKLLLLSVCIYMYIPGQVYPLRDFESNLARSSPFQESPPSMTTAGIQYKEQVEGGREPCSSDYRPPHRCLCRETHFFCHGSTLGKRATGDGAPPSVSVFLAVHQGSTHASGVRGGEATQDVI